nr:uncharacterized protein LOC4332430 isoform X2 [Oryza sativa Japonica Group]
MALSSSLLHRLLRGSTPVSSSSAAASSILRATFCSSSSSAPLPTESPLSSVFGDGAEVSNVPPLTAPKLFISGLSRLTTDEKLKNAFAPFGQLLEVVVLFPLTMLEAMRLMADYVFLINLHTIAPACGLSYGPIYFQ